MSKIKFNFDRKPLSEDIINSKQDFQSILNTVKNSPKKTWTKYYYFGTIGLAGLAATIGIFKLIQNFDNIADETNVTLKSNEITVFVADHLADEKTVQLAFNSPEELMSSAFVTPPIAKSKKANIICDTKSDSNELFVDTLVIPIEVEKDSKQNKVSCKPAVPVIAGVSSGNIKWEDFKSNTIFVDNDYEIKQFSIQYTSKSGDRTIVVKGNTISPEIIKELEQVGMNQTIFISNIISASHSNDLKHLLSMELNILFK